MQLQGPFQNSDSKESVTGLGMPTQKPTQTSPMCMTSPLSKHVQPIVHPDLIHKRGKHVPGHTALRLLNSSCCRSPSGGRRVTDTNTWYIHKEQR